MKAYSGGRVWWGSHISTNRRGAGIRTCSPTSSSPTASARRRSAGVDRLESLYHGAKAAGLIYLATVRPELRAERGFECNQSTSRGSEQLFGYHGCK
jgi:hypothetical protein